MNLTESSIIPGCYYKTTWQANKGMRFILKYTLGDKALLETPRSHKQFWTLKSSLVFIISQNNIKKAKILLGQDISNHQPNIISETDTYIFKKKEGMTKFPGCQCFDCDCYEQFIPKYYLNYTVQLKTGKKKSYIFTSLQEAENFIKNL